MRLPSGRKQQFALSEDARTQLRVCRAESPVLASCMRRLESGYVKVINSLQILPGAESLRMPSIGSGPSGSNRTAAVRNKDRSPSVQISRRAVYLCNRNAQRWVATYAETRSQRQKQYSTAGAGVLEALVARELLAMGHKKSPNKTRNRSGLAAEMSVGWGLNCPCG
jgi:hypothetical protein